jgi:hypothetical protein
MRSASRPTVVGRQREVHPGTGKTAVVRRVPRPRRRITDDRQPSNRAARGRVLLLLLSRTPAAYLREPTPRRRVGRVGPGVRTQATTMSLWTSRPLQCSTMTSITSSSPQSMEGRLEGPHRKESEVRARSNTVWCPRSPRLLAGLALLARRFFRPAGDSRIARFLRVGGYVAILALIPAKAIVEQFAFQPPRGGIDLRLYRLISGPDSWLGEILFLVFMALYGAAILWMTSQRSRVAPATLAIGTGAGIVLGVMYAVAPLDSNGPPTNPWLPGANIDPPVVLAWILLLRPGGGYGCSRATLLRIGQLTSARRCQEPPSRDGRAPHEPCRRVVRHRSRHWHAEHGRAVEFEMLHTAAIAA